MTAPGERLRRLPVPVRPASRETIGSFLNRLALANSLRTAHILMLAAISNTLRDFSPATDDTRGWSETTPDRIAALAGRPLPELAAAIPLLDTMTPANSPMHACPHCTAAKNITGMVIIRSRPGDYLCTRHQHWLRGPWRHSTAALPELAASQRRHDKHTRTVPDAEIARVHQQAGNIVAEWLESEWHPALTDRWHERNHRLTTVTAGSRILHAEVITHPEKLAVARLLIISRGTPGIRPAEVSDRLGIPRPCRPHPLDPLQDLLSS